MADLVCFSVADALDGLFRLERRSPTLRGSVPLRVAQACVPLLQGNAFGWQVVLPDKWPLVRGPLGWSLDLADDALASLRQRYQQGLARALSAGWLQTGSPWHQFLMENALFLTAQRRLGRQPQLVLWTGLFVQPDRGLGLRLLSVGNRRSHSFLLQEALYASNDVSPSPSPSPSPKDGSLIPLCLQLSLASEARRSPRLLLGGELACLAVMPLSSTFAVRSLAECKEVGRAHCAFFDASYFRHKEGSATRRYRKQVQVRPKDSPAWPPPPTTSSSEDAWGPRLNGEVIVAGPTEFELVAEDHVITPSGPQPTLRSPHAPRLQHVMFRNLIDFSAHFDGASVRIDFDSDDLAKKAQPLWQAFRRLYGAAFVEQHPGALLYLSKYFTTHPPGEPHFFVKPWAFTRTDAGCSVLVDGYPGSGYEVLRGVIACDQFHATPAVFSVQRSDEALQIAARTPLLRVWALPRPLLSTAYRTIRGSSQ